MPCVIWKVLSYWNHLLSGPIAVLLDVGTPLSSPCCVATIDCLSSLGPKIFDKLPVRYPNLFVWLCSDTLFWLFLLSQRDKHALVVTSIFQLSSASDNAVKVQNIVHYSAKILISVMIQAAAVRAVGVFVKYPCTFIVREHSELLGVLTYSCPILHAGCDILVGFM